MSDIDETIATFDHKGGTYQLDHLGIANPWQWGMFAIYRDGALVTDFEIGAAAFKPEHRPALPDVAELTDDAKVALDTLDDDTATS
jgi:hypothetical protein